MRHALAGCVLLLSILTLPARAHADGGEIAWDRCAGLPGATTSRTFACADDTTRHRIVVSADTPLGLSDFLAAVVTFDIAFDSAGIPDWWRFADGGCRAGLAVADTGVVSDGDPVGCVGPWGGSAIFSSIGVTEGYLSPNHIRLQFTLAQSSSSAFPAATTCRIGVLTLPSLDTVTGGAGSGCAGCATATCIALNKIELFGAGGGYRVIPCITSHVVGFQQPTTALCATPSRHSSWGAIKSLYR